MLFQRNRIPGSVFLLRQSIRIGACQDQYIFPPGFILLIIRKGAVQGQGDGFLISLGQFPAEGDPAAAAQGIPQLFQGGLQPVGRFIQYDRPFLPDQLAQDPLMFFFVGRQESFKAEPAGCHTGHGQGCDQGAGSGNGSDPDPFLYTAGRQDFSRIGYGRCAGIADAGDILAPAQMIDQDLRLIVFVVFVVAGQGLSDLKMIEQADGIAGIFRRDQVHTPQCFQGPGADITQIADGGRYQI